MFSQRNYGYRGENDIEWEPEYVDHVRALSNRSWGSNSDYDVRNYDEKYGWNFTRSRGTTWDSSASVVEDLMPEAPLERVSAGPADPAMEIEIDISNMKQLDTPEEDPVGPLNDALETRDEDMDRSRPIDPLHCATCQGIGFTPRHDNVQKAIIATVKEVHDGATKSIPRWGRSCRLIPAPPATVRSWSATFLFLSLSHRLF